MKFAYWHPTIFPLQLSIFFSLLSTFERLLLRTPSCFLVLITELWQMFPRLIWDGRRQPSVLRTARSHLCVQWSAKPCSDICHPSTRPRLQGMYQICQSALHPNASQPPLISKRFYSSVCDIWSLIDVRSNPEETTSILRSKSQLISSWSLLSSYHVTKTLKLEKRMWEMLHLHIYLSPNVCLTNLILFVVMHYCFYADDSNVSRFCFLMKSSVDEVCLRIVFSLSFPFMSLTFCR